MSVSREDMKWIHALKLQLKAFQMKRESIDSKERNTETEGVNETSNKREADFDSSQKAPSGREEGQLAPRWWTLRPGSVGRRSYCPSKA